MRGVISKNFTRSTTYLMPMLGHSVKEFINVVNCYMYDESKPEYDNHIFLLHKFDDDVRSGYLSYEDSLKQHELYVDSYDPNNPHVMFVFKVPEEYQKEYDLFKAGQYSKFRDSYKRHILKFQGGLFQTKKIRQVLYKSEKLHKEWEERLGVEIPLGQELSSIPDRDKETYKLSDREESINISSIIFGNEESDEGKE